MSTEQGVLLPRVLHRRMVLSALKAHGLNPRDASACEDFCSEALSLGIRTHATPKLFSLLEHVLHNLNRHGKFQVEKKLPSMELWDGDGQIGIPVANAAVKRALKMAVRSGIAGIVVRNFTHCLSGVIYLNRIAKELGPLGQRFMGFYFTTAGFGDEVVPHGGVRGSMGTNPIGFAIPLGDNSSTFLFDGATSERSMGYVAYARAAGLQLEPGVALDAEGNPTLDPHVAKKLCAFGGHKGSSFCAFVELFAGLAGGGIPTERNRARGELSHFVIFVVNLDAIRAPGTIGRDAQLESARRVCESIYKNNGKARAPGRAKFEFASRLASSGNLFIPDAMQEDFERIAKLGNVRFDFGALERAEI